jgi:hypothetical protein
MATTNGKALRMSESANAILSRKRKAGDTSLGSVPSFAGTISRSSLQSRGTGGSPALQYRFDPRLVTLSPSKKNQ